MLKSVLLMTLILTVGCVERTVTLTSEPAGALVHLNDEPVGRTPVTVAFTFYGIYDVRLEKDGYESLWTTHEADAPWWEAPGPDIIAEMIPRNHVNLAWHFTLTPALAANDVDPDLLLEHAQQMRSLTAE